MYINIIHHKKLHPRIPSTTLVLRYIFKISIFVTSIIWSQIYSICSNFAMFIGIFKIFDQIKSKANQIYLKQVEIIQDMMSIHYQIFELQKDYTFDFNFWGAQCTFTLGFNVTCIWTYNLKAMDNKVQLSNVYITTPNNERGENDYTLFEQPNQ